MSEKKTDPRRGTETEVKERPKVKKPRLYKVIFHNDDYTTMEFVIEVLKTFFHKDHAEATQLMLYVHHKGRAVVGTFPYDVAESKVHQVTDYAQSNGHPLLVTMEPE